MPLCLHKPPSLLSRQAIISNHEVFASHSQPSVDNFRCIPITFFCSDGSLVVHAVLRGGITDFTWGKANSCRVVVRSVNWLLFWPRLVCQWALVAISRPTQSWCGRSLFCRPASRRHYHLHEFISSDGIGTNRAFRITAPIASNHDHNQHNTPFRYRRHLGDERMVARPFIHWTSWA